MKKHGWIHAGLTLVLMIAIPGLAPGQEKQDQPPEGMSPQESAEMAAWEKAATPGPNHELLSDFVGTWDTKVQVWMGPDADPQESSGKSENRWVLGKRYLHSTYEGDFQGGPFHGIGYTGYDNIEKKFVSVWMDTISTTFMVEKGDYDPSSRTFTYYSEFKDPMGNKVLNKSRVRLLGKDKHVVAMWHKKGDADYVKALEITYTRSKSSAETGDSQKKEIATASP